MRNVLNVDMREAFAACRLPILYLLGKQDRLVRRRSVDEMLRIQPNIRVVEIDGPHLLLQREPAKCFEAINRFLEAVL
jgi:pimeloyl-ACP methyl ester carboxylesterase